MPNLCNHGIFFIKTFFFFLFLFVTAAPVFPGSVVINEFYPMGKGKWPDWIELYNKGNSTVHLNGLYLSDNLNVPFKWKIPSHIYIEPGAHYLFLADKKNIADHTNFRLNARGETIGLFNSEGKLLDMIEFGPQIHVRSVGRFPDGSDTWHFFTNPTPKAPNRSPAQSFSPFNQVNDSQLPEPNFSLEGGVYSVPIELSLTTDRGTILFTTDGSEPDYESKPWNGPVRIEETSVLRARVLSNGVLGPVATHTYLLNEAAPLAVVSLALDPVYLWDEEFGIYVKGIRWKENNYDEQLFNYKQNWWRNVHFEFIEKGRTRVSEPMQMRIYGGASRGRPQKSLALRTRGNPLDHRFFIQKNITGFHTLLLRNSGDDWGKTMFRDALMQSLIAETTSIDYQAYRPVAVYLNGEYWGVANLREKIDTLFIAGNHDLDPDRIDLLERHGRIMAGDGESYRKLQEFCSGHDLSDDRNFLEAASMMDVEQFTDYIIAEIFFINKDWPENNVRFWRHQTQEGRWRWILYDTDNGFMCTGTEPDYNALKRALRPDRGWSNLLVRSLLQNRGYRDFFIQRFAAHLNITFSTPRVQGMIRQFKSRIAPEMEKHIQRWEKPGSMEQWHREVEKLSFFAAKRPGHALRHLQKHFGLAVPVELTVINSMPEAGTITVAGIPALDAEFSGAYFPEIPLQLRAMPRKGYVFAGWEGVVDDTTPLITISLTRDTDRILARWARVPD